MSDVDATHAAGMGLKHSENEVKELKEFDFQMYGDIKPDKMPRTVFDGLEFIASIPKQLKENAFGKGKPVKYILMRVEALQQLFDIESKSANLWIDISDSIIDSCVKIFDKMSKVSRRMNDIEFDLTAFEKSVPKRLASHFNNIKADFDQTLSFLKSNITVELNKVIGALKN